MANATKTANKIKSEISLSILVSAHNEDLIAVKTLRSIRRALYALDKNNVSYEVICVLDNPTETTTRVFSKEYGFKSRIVTIHAGELSANRMTGIDLAKGKYIATIDADDLCSLNWFIDGLMLCRENPNAVVHAEYSINFGSMNILWKKTNSKSIAIESLYNVQANRWDSALIAHVDIMKKYKYFPNSDGFGSEDWDFNMRTLRDGIKHLVVPKTILFVRRRESGSELDKQRSQKRIVRPSQMLNLSNFRKINHINFSNKRKASILSIIKLKVFRRESIFFKTARVVARHSTVLRKIRQNQINSNFPDWLIKEWKSIHLIEKKLFPSNDVLCSMKYYDAEQKEFGLVYKQIADVTSCDFYDYILFVPYINRGGADLVSIKYANSIHKQCPEKKVCVIATNEKGSEWSSKLDDGIDFVSFGEITFGMCEQAKLDILARFITNIKPKCIHIINSSMAYNFVKIYNQYISANNIKIVVCAFCEDMLSDGHITGYVHTLLPDIYNYTDKILTDNQTIINNLCSEYGYDLTKFSCHYISIDKHPSVKKVYKQTNKLLWASRIAFQKQPGLLVEIAERLYKVRPDLSIDVYGSFEKDINPSIFNGSKNIQYRGPFNGGLYSLALDDYDAFLYTSLFDGMPNIILESANAKIPIITSGSGGIKELCRNGETAYVVDRLVDASSYVDSILDFYRSDLKFRKKMTNYAHDIVSDRHNQEHFDNDIKNDIINLF